MKMKVSTLLVASALLVALVLLAGSASAPIDVSLKEALPFSDKFQNLSIIKDYFVEDVTVLPQFSKCGGVFFCKAYDILLHSNVSTLLEEKLKKEKESGKQNLKTYLKYNDKLMGHLEVYNSKVNCSVLLDDVKPTNVTTQLCLFFGNLSDCIRKHNFKVSK